MVLFAESGGTEQSRIDEAGRIVAILLPLVDEMTTREAQFVQQMYNTKSCSPKQLFWLRDLNTKYS